MTHKDLLKLKKNWIYSLREGIHCPKTKSLNHLNSAIELPGDLSCKGIYLVF